MSIYPVKMEIDFSSPLSLDIDINYVQLFLELINRKDILSYKIVDIPPEYFQCIGDYKFYCIEPYTAFRSALLDNRVIDLPASVLKRRCFTEGEFLDQLYVFKDAIPVFDKSVNSQDVLVLAAISY